ncbi:MAG: A/G-specific adenine glycosylase [Saprospiraceae bacterium]|jgi:A/G-specific adenine glycosylase
MKSFSGELISWYKQNKRDLPWRHTVEPYRIWLSEIMLQQTRVEQGLPYYNRFLTLFPTVFDLASASEQEVLNAWKGLGYYSRARRLHAAAKQLVDNKNGKFPVTFQELQNLPGVGSYTAAAIASFCFSEAVPVVDGNVYRVLSRLYGMSIPIDTGKGKKTFFDLASELIDKSRPALFNQGIMEFGALQCVPRNPDCENCPFVNSCEAFHLKKVNEFPVKSRKVKRKSRYFTYLVVENNGKYLTNKRGEKGIWANMQEFPLVETSQEVSSIEEMSKAKLADLPFVFKLESLVDYRKHILTHQDIFYTFWKVQLESNVNELFKYHDKEELNEMPFPKLLENFILNL